MRSPDRPKDSKEDISPLNASLHEPLLILQVENFDENENNKIHEKNKNENNVLVDQENSNNDVNKKSEFDDIAVNQNYANNAPKIILETITASTALIVIALTYIFFIIGFAIDFSITYNSFNRENIEINALNCGSSNITRNFIGCSASSHSNSFGWNTTVAKRIRDYYYYY